MALPSVACTYNPIHEKEFVWIIENVNRISEQVNGPSFFLIPNTSQEFQFICECEEYKNHTEVHVFLNTGKEKTAFNFICDLTMRNANDKILLSTNFEYQSGYKKFDDFVAGLDLRRKPGRLEFIDLPGYKLVLKANFSRSVITSNELQSTIKRIPASNELLKNFKTMFECGYAHDVTFSVDGQMIPAHTAVLCVRSPVFSKMFQHDMLEKTSKNVVIEDFDFAIFKKFLLFLYTGVFEEEQAWEAVISLYSVADKYEVESLRLECSQMLADNLSVASVCRVLVLADLHEDSELKEAAKMFTRRNFAQVVETSDWEKIVEDNPRLASDALRSIKCIPGAK